MRCMGETVKAEAGALYAVLIDSSSLSANEMRSRYEPTHEGGRSWKQKNRAGS